MLRRRARHGPRVLRLKGIIRKGRGGVRLEEAEDVFPLSSRHIGEAISVEDLHYLVRLAYLRHELIGADGT